MPFLTNDPLLKEDNYVFFRGGDFPDHVANKIFKIGFTQQIPRYISKFIANGKYVDIELDKVGLYPESVSTLFELRFGFKGNVLLYPRYPTTQYFNVLEKSGFTPPDDPSTDPDKRYIGCYTSVDAPFDVNPPLLAEYTVKNFDTIVYRIYADSVEDEKVVIRCIVNRCQLIELDEDEEKEVKENWDDYIAKGILRIIPHPKLIRWEVR